MKDKRRESLNLNGYEVMAAVTCRVNEEYGFVPHDHTLVYVERGAIHIEVANEEPREIQAGNFAFIRKDYRLSARRVVDKELGEHISYFIYFPEHLLRGYYKIHKPIAEKSNDLVVTVETSDILRDVFQQFKKDVDSHTVVNDNDLNERLTKVIDIIVAGTPEICSSLFRFATDYRPDLMKFMEDNYQLDLTLEEMAISTGRSVAGFKRDFAKLSTLSPQQWVINRRLEEGRCKLQQTNMSIGDIVKEIGFKNFSHFSRVYRKKFGHSPGAERNPKQ